MKSFFKALDHRVTVAYADHCGEDPFIFCINNARYNNAETHDASIPTFGFIMLKKVDVILSTLSSSSVRGI